MAWGDDAGRQKPSIETPAKIAHSPPGTASRTNHASESCFCCPHGAPAGTDAPLEGPSTRGRGGHSSFPGSQTRVPGTLGARVACTSRGISVTAVCGQGRPGCTRMGHSCSRLLWGSAVLGDSAWWTLLLLLQLVCTGALRGTCCSWAGTTVSARPPGAACAGRRETGRACGARRRGEQRQRSHELNVRHKILVVLRHVIRAGPSSVE